LCKSKRHVPIAVVPVQHVAMRLSVVFAVCSNIGDNSVKVQGFGVKVRIWTPFWQGLLKVKALGGMHEIKLQS